LRKIFWYHQAPDDKIKNVDIIKELRGIDEDIVLTLEREGCCSLFLYFGMERYPHTALHGQTGDTRPIGNLEDPRKAGSTTSEKSALGLSLPAADRLAKDRSR